jgi:hypothetical protein
MVHRKKNTNFTWLRTTNEVGVSGADNEHDNQERTNWRGEVIKEDWEGGKVQKVD